MSPASSGARSIAAALLVLLAAGAAIGHVRLRNPGNGAALHWASPGAVAIVIASAGSDDVPASLHFPALRAAIAAWNDAPGSAARLVEDASPAQQARDDWESDGLHQIRFDESNESGFFPDGTGIVAITPVWFAGDGRITDADVLFNGEGFAFTTSRAPGCFDVQDVATHELGHVLGLDHTGWAGASMYPYVDPSVILQRSLARDDVLGMRDAYPSAAFASIAGRIRRATDHTAVAGAHVVALDAQGRTAAGALADRGGAFRLAGLDPGTYTLRADPLDFPVSAANLDEGHAVAVDFESSVLGSFAVAAGQSLATGDLLVERDVAISLGRKVDRYPLRCIAGRTRALQMRGSGLDAGSSLAASDPSLAVAVTAWFGTAVLFEVTVPPGAEPGHADLTATSPTGERSTVAAALEITPPDPSIASVAPSSGSPAGGALVTILGGPFAAGSRVVLGDVVYADGEPGGCTVVDPGTIRLVTAPTIGGLHDAVVIDPTGVEGRASGAFLVATTPAIDSVFPAAGSAAGGTAIVVRGRDFAPGCTVTIAGVPQGAVAVDDATRLSFVTAPGLAGGPYVLELANPGGATATSAFAYVAGADPQILSIDPPQGSTSGGETVTLHGAAFSATSEVVFGADPDTGAGGAPAASVAFIDAATLEVVTPPHAGGAASVLVRDPATGQAALAPQEFSFASSGGGGGCSLGTIGGPPSPSEPFAGAGWILLVLAMLALRARRAGARAAGGSA